MLNTFCIILGLMSIQWVLSISKIQMKLCNCKGVQRINKKTGGKIKKYLTTKIFSL